jgi:peptide-methionine (S)-S-oxide reductase
MTEKATFAAGCFWGVEAAFREVPGVRRTTVGYTGGTVPNATYEQVCTGQTGHAEAVEVEFDPSEVSYEELLDTFWEAHDPTQLNRQGWDIGTQYRSAIFVHGSEQEAAAIRSRDERQQHTRKPIVTEVAPASDFYRAEEYHQRYLEKRGRATCAAGVADAEPAQPSWLSTVAARLGARD